MGMDTMTIWYQEKKPIDVPDLRQLYDEEALQHQGLPRCI
jgi:hypothetical protein